MPDAIVKAIQIEIDPLKADDPVGAAAKRLVEEQHPALPVVENDGRFVGIFGEREFMKALFPGYVGTLASARLVSRSIDVSIERRITCQEEPVRLHLTTDPVVVEDDFSDVLLAELFLHHRVLIIPIATDGRVHAMVKRSDFFRELVGLLDAAGEEQHD